MIDRTVLIKRTLVRLGLVLSALLLAAAAAAAQQPVARTLTLEQALQVAGGQSEQVTIARAGVQRARGEQYRARSEYYPQLLGSLSYTRTLRTEFSSLSESSDSTSGPPPAPCNEFRPNRLLPLSERVDSLESALRCRDEENPFGDLFSNLPFGRANQWNLGLSLSQSVFTGGRVQAQNRLADAGQRTAQINLAATNAQLVLDVTTAYYNAVLSDQLVTIADATLTQAETTLGHVRLARQVGDQPEFELLRAQVTRDNQRPVVIQRRADRDLAQMRLKQLLNFPLDQALALTTGLAQEPAAVSAAAEQTDTAAAARAPVREAAEAVRVQEALRSVARSQRLPSLVLSSQFGRVAYPGGGLPGWSDFRSNWTVTAGVQLPIFTGGRIKGDELVAQANLTEARVRLQQTRELAALDTRNSTDQLRSAEASWQASTGTVEQANRAYTIADLRFKEGLSTQIELNDSRILLQQAQANRAVAARDLQIARVRLTLLQDLPITVNGGFQTQQSQPSQQQPQPQQRIGGAVPASGAGNR